MCARRRDARTARAVVWFARGLVVLACAGAFLLVMAGVGLADDTCSPGNPGDCRNTAVVIGTIATLTAVLTISLVGLRDWSKEWSPRRCDETLRALDADIDKGLAGARRAMAQRDKFREQNSTSPGSFAKEMALADSRLEEYALAVEDLFARRQAVMQGCGDHLKGRDRAKPAIDRNRRIGGYITGVEPPIQPPKEVVPLDHLGRREGGSAAIDPEAVKTSVDEMLKGKIPKDWQDVVKNLDPKISGVWFRPAPDGSVTIHVEGKVQAGIFGGTSTGEVKLQVRNGELVATIEDVPVPAMPFKGKLMEDLNKQMASFNRDLYSNGVEVKGVTVGPDGKLQITTGPK